MADRNELFTRAQKVIPGGVNSAVRAFGSVGGTPVYMERGKGARMTSTEGQEFLDFCCSWGPLILGHAHEEVINAVCEAAQRGTTFGTNTEQEVVFSEQLCELVSGMDQVRLANSGTEATMTGLRLARGYTGRTKILKFEGCFHGHADHLLVSGGSGLLTSGVASSAGVSEGAAADTLVAPYNDPDAVAEIVETHKDDLAAIIVEPIAGNMGLVQPNAEFLQTLRSLADKSGALLVFDEVITGFRLGCTSYGSICGVVPDLTCLGKIIGGGLPIGAVGGRRDVMQYLAPCGSVYQSGTLSANPVAVAAGNATINVLQSQPPYDHIDQLGKKLAAGIEKVAEETGRDLYVARKGGMFTLFFQSGPVTNLTDAKKSDTSAHAEFFHRMLEQGIYLPPSQFELSFISAAHTEADIDEFINAARKALSK